ncbi:MAG: trypsin-like peptidase domain-containing protein [Pseudomonadota bacterium]
MSTQGLTAFGLFVGRSIVLGLAIACVVMLIKPNLVARTQNEGEQSASYARAVAASAQAVVNVYTTRRVLSPAGTPTSTPLRSAVQTNLGSGVIIDADGYIVTNNHVITQAAAIRIQLADGRVADADIVGQDPDTDLALLKVSLSNLEPIQLGRSDQMQIGDVVLAIGNPYGLSQTVTQGIISATGRGLLGLTTFENYIQTDAAINSGNSGGALINTRGELIGINTAVISREVNIQGISFAIPINLVSGVVRALRENGRVLRGWLGLDMRPLTDEQWSELGLAPGTGILLGAVQHQGPAWQAGIRPGDVLVSINDLPVTNNQEALLTVAGYTPGTELNIELIRAGQRFRTIATAGDRSESTR